jgi:hypothetical protein
MESIIIFFEVEKMTEIYFSHKYFKMPDGFEESVLLQIVSIDRKELTDAFESYDATYAIGYNETVRYSLPKGKLLILLLKSKYGILWTTIRSWNPEKEKYYKSLCGKELTIVIK